MSWKNNGKKKNDPLIIRINTRLSARFLMSHNTDFTTLSVSQMLQICDRVYNAESTPNVRDGRACPRSEFPVPHPCNKPQFQTSFPNIDPNKPVHLDKGAPFCTPLDSLSNSLMSGTKKSCRKPNPRADLV